MRNLIFLLLLVRGYVGSSQNPGNIGVTNLTAWWKADGLTLGNVLNWTTTYPTGASSITVSDPSAPYPQATETPTISIFNYNRIVDFNGNASGNGKFLSNTSSLNLLTNQNSGNQGTFFSVYANPYTGSNDGVVTYKNGLHGIQFRGWGRLALGNSDSPNGTRNFSPNTSGKPLIISYKGNKSGSSTMVGFRNDLIFNSSSASSALLLNSLTFGAKYSGFYHEHFSGFISEVIFYNSDLSNTDISKVNSYLAVKYGITLDNTGGGIQGNYLATNNTVVWTASLNPSYHNDVIGIARDVNESLHQKQSHSFDDSTRIYVGTLSASNTNNTSSITNTLSYVMMGKNLGEMCSTTSSNLEKPIGLPSCLVNSRIEREWKISKTNFSQTFNTDFKLNTCAILGSINTTHLRLLVDNDGDFSNGGTTCFYNGDGSGISISYANPIVTIANISNVHIPNNSTRYITIASANPLTPLPIELLNFSASCRNPFNVVNWTTATESNNSHFILEKSLDAINFEPIVKINGRGTVSQLTNYEFVDSLVKQNNTYYYRLKQVELDNTFDYSGIISTTCNEVDFNTFFLAFPNPSNSKELNIRNHVSNDDVLEISIYDAIGKLCIYQKRDRKKGDTEFSINVSDLAKGIYFIQLASSQYKVKTIKYIIN